MKTARNGDIVKIRYLIQSGNGKRKEGPVVFKLGEGRVLPCLEKAIFGMSPGETRIENVSPEYAFGRHEPDLVISVDRSKLRDNSDPKIGDRMRIRLPDGRSTDMRVVNKADTTVTLDANHPFAGEDLTFVIQLLEISGNH